MSLTSADNDADHAGSDVCWRYLRLAVQLACRGSMPDIPAPEALLKLLLFLIEIDHAERRVVRKKCTAVQTIASNNGDVISLCSAAIDEVKPKR